ncbi:MAG: glycosyltransferase family 4 protein [Lachnospiraceae bacterium]|nr:glycosyltransferase family 4 protein [Lachnospiraceae bacterium]
MENKKRLLIYAHYYGDVASTAQILQELAEGMLDAFNITVICVVPSYLGTIEDKYKTQKFYFEELNGVNIVRIRVPEFDKTKGGSRVKNILSYFFGAIRATFKVGKMDYVFSISQPPILGGLLGVWGKWVKRAKYVYNVQDFNPEQIMSVGYTKNRIVLGAMMWFDKFSCKRSDLIITVGRDLGETIEKRFARKEGSNKCRKVPKYTIINNWINEKEIYPLDCNNETVVAFRKKYGLEDKFVFMYSGNIGLYYDLEGIIKIIEKFQGMSTSQTEDAPDGKEVVFAFVGAGSVLDKLVLYTRQHKMKNVVFIPYQDKADLIYSLNAGDVHFCVNAKGIKGVSCPSKFYGLAAVGKPVLGVLEEGSEVRSLIEEVGCGLVAEPGDYAGVEDKIRWFIENSNSNELKKMGMKGRKYLVKELTEEVSVGKYKKAIMAL